MNSMIRYHLANFLTAAFLALPGGARAAGPAAPFISDMALEGEIQGENIVFSLSMKVEPQERNSELALVAGDVAYMDGDFPRGAELVREGNRYVLKLRSARRQEIGFRFASRPAKEGDWRRTWFEVPSSSVRKLSLVCDREDLEVRFPGALEVQRGKSALGKPQVTAFLGLTNRFEVTWKPEIKRLEGELVVACDANTIATASVGALRMDQFFTYRVIQGELSKLVLALPAVNVTQVRGEDIQDWRIEPAGTNASKLVVTLSRPRDDLYRLQVLSEVGLPKFPCKFALPVITPENVIRTSGFLMLGTDSAIKLQFARMAGLTQMDQAAFPTIDAGGQGDVVRRSLPARNAQAYQFANMPYTAEISADDVVPAITADSRHELSVVENELSFTSSIELDIRDAPAREVLLESEAGSGWTVTGVSGQHVAEADVDVRDTGTARTIEVPFKQAVTGVTLIQVHMEKTLAASDREFPLPSVKVSGARSERGYIVAAAEKGLRLRATKSEGLREVHTGSAPMRVENAQLAYRFKEPGWQAAFGLERTQPALHSEVFHVVSLGEGVLYSSAAISYHIGGAPLQELKLRIPAEIQTLELTGADIEGWTRSNDVCTVRLQARVLGDYTLLVTYDRQYTLPTADIGVGSVETIGTESEVGFIAVASSLSLKLDDAGPLPPSLILVDREELPQEYSKLVTAPILRSYRYVRTPHLAQIKVQMLDTEQLLGQVADYVKLSTVLSRDGEAVTTATYFIKNATRQFFMFELPEGAKVWTIKSVSESGARENLLSQQSGRKYLVPVARPRDPNTALRIEVTYAQPCSKPGFWRSGLAGTRLHGPDLPESHATFAGWRIEAPENNVIAGISGNMTVSSGDTGGWLRWTLRKTEYFMKAILDGPRGLTFSSLWQADRQEGRVVELIRTVNLKGMEPLGVDLQMVPQWVGACGSVRLLVGCGLAAIVLLLGGALRKSTALLAAGLTSLIVSLGQFSQGRSALAALLILFVVVTILRLLGLRILRALWWLLCLPARRLRVRRERKAAQRVVAESAAKVEDLPFEPVVEPPPRGENGGAAIRLLVLMLLAASVAVRAFSEAAPPQPQASQPTPPPAPAPAPAPAPVPASMDNVTLTIEGPRGGRDTEQSAKIVARYEFELKEPARFLIAPAGCVVTLLDLGSRDLDVRSGEGGYTLEAKEEGKYSATVTFRAPVQVKDGQSQLYLPIPPALRSTAKIRIPEADQEIQSDAAVVLKTSTTKDATEADAVFGIGRVPVFTWRPRVRIATTEASVFYCTVNTLATLQPGVVEVVNRIACQIAQGELRQLRMIIPAGMNVTAVQGADIATWSFDPASRKLEALLGKGATGNYQLTVIAQISCEGLPYAVKAGVPAIEGAARQRGALALAASDTVQLRVDEAKALNPMNIEDFALEASASPDSQRLRMTTAIRKAYRYDQASQVTASVSAERVLPEIRVTENGSISVSDERTVLATKLELEVSKAGVFSVDLTLPDGFDVESLTGADVSHWDEIKEGAHGVTVFFSRQVTDKTSLDLVVSRTEKGIEPTIVAPRVGLKDARKHTGRLIVSGERGLRMMVQDQSGVDLKKAAEEGISQKGVLVFEILRPAWEVTLRTEVLTPVVKPEVLQVVDLTEGMLMCRNYLRYTIDNAGVKTFRVKAPAPGVTLSVAGRNIARVQEVDKEKGIWQVDLHGKVENQFALSVNYQLPYERAKQRVLITPLQTLDTDPQRGYLVVSCGGRVQIEPEGTVNGLKVEDPRNVPPAFGAGDLSSAVRCYRIVQPEWELPLSVVRHETAQVLPASVNQVRMTSVLSEDNKVLTRVLMQLDVGSLRLLKFTLPGAEDVLWTALVNGREATTSRDGQSYCIPLEEQAAGQNTLVDLVYSGSSAGGRFSARQKFDAPQFAGLPLKDIEWAFYVLPTLRYYSFGGTMEYRKDLPEEVRAFGAEQYWAWNVDQRNATLQKARQVLNDGEELLKKGNEKGAMKAFQDAMNYSQAEVDLNEDARVQLRNLQKQQVKVGLFQRRGAMRSARNIMDEAQQEPQQQEQQITQQQAAPQAAQTVDRLLSEKDKSALEAVADRMIDQQSAAAGVVRAINVTIPENGRLLRFSRSLLISPTDELSVTFKTSSGTLLGAARAIWPIAAIFAGLWVVIVLRKKG